jgi:hypothetical protein
MSIVELRDLDQARRFLLEGLWVQRVLPPTAVTVKPALEWALEIAAAGQPLPPIGVIADLGNVAFALDQGLRAQRDNPVRGLAAGLARTYEDHVLGKVYADWNFERAGDALRRLQGRDRARGLAFVVNQFRERAGFAGVLLSPAVIKGLLELAPDEALARGWETLARDGISPLLPELYEDLIASARRLADVLGPEDVFELEHGTALAELGQRVALRQLLQAAQRLEALLPQHRVRPLAGRQEVPTRVLDEDTYPVGGYSSVSTRGTIESLLHSQLAYMERNERPDLFDIKYLRDELLFYSRDENQFLRRRRTFVIALFPDLVRTRFKDAQLPWQRCILWLGLLVAAVRKLSDWLSTDALCFDFVIVDQGVPDVLAHEQGLLQTIFREAIANGTVRIGRSPSAEAVALDCSRQARRSLCHCLTVGVEGPPELQAADTIMTQLRIDGSMPVLRNGADEMDVSDSEEPLDGWGAALERLLQVWI